MKKVIGLITVFLACAVAACAVCLAGCSSESESDSYVHLIDFNKYEIGDEVPIYPDCEFDYKMDDGNIVHISKITGILTEKNFITEDSIIEGFYRAYTITVTAYGFTTTKLTGQKIQISFAPFPGSTSWSAYSEVDESGNLYWEVEVKTDNVAGINFFSLRY